jgi:4-amino-4-deoxy-L-arabinose transferase-like glycosyltransferase
VGALLVLSMWLRASAPSDLWDQTQPRTIAYTADMVTRGGTAWILALDAEGFPATKPPLYNWLAAPFVAAFGRASEWAHKAPSVLSLCAIAASLVILGNRLAPRAGTFAGLAFVSTYALFKLGYLARPDMVLSAILFAGWWASVQLLSGVGGRRHAALFWLSVVLAAWVKGPVAALLPMFAIVGSFAVHRTWRPLAAFRPLWGIPLAIVLAPSWYVAAGFVNREHLVKVLWYAEIYGRFTGEGEEGGHRGLMGTIRGLPFMTFYFFTRFAPWSVAALLGALALLDRRDGGIARWRLAKGGTALVLATVWTVLVVATFTLSSGKRADYLAPAYGPAALVAGWWLASDRYSPARPLPWVPAVVAVGTIVAVGMSQLAGPVYTPATTRRFDEMVATLTHLPHDAPLYVVAPQLPHLAILASTPTPSENSYRAACALADSGQPVYLAVADYGLAPLIYTRASDGRAELVACVEHTYEAERVYGYPSPLLVVKLLPAH